jgi:hypothetical protein
METLFPVIIITYVGCFSTCFPANNFEYFRGFIMAFMLLGETRKCVTNIGKVCFFVDKHISSWERFLSSHHWDMNKIMEIMVNLMKENLKENLMIYGAYLACIDTTLISKVKGKMIGVQKWPVHSGNPDKGEYLIGHHWALLGLIGKVIIGEKNPHICFPLLANLISGQKSPLGFVVNKHGITENMNFWDGVCPLVAQLRDILKNAPVRVVADAYFSKASFINWMLSISVNVITRMRVDAVGWDDPVPEPVTGKKKRGRKPIKPKKGKQWKISHLLKELPLTEVQVNIYGKMTPLEIVSRKLWIRDVEKQKVNVVVIRTKKEPVILLSTDLELPVEKIIEIYSMRFSIEIAIRDLKQSFGIGDYQSVNTMAIKRFVALSIISFSLWRMAILQELYAKWLYSSHNYSIFSFKRISQSLRKVVIQSIFQKFAIQANFQNSIPVPEQIIRLIV